MVDTKPPSDVQEAVLALARTAHETLEIVSFRPECAQVICRGPPRPALFCADHSTDRISPGECQLLDDWLWLAPFEMVDYGTYSLSHHHMGSAEQRHHRAHADGYTGVSRMRHAEEEVYPRRSL